MLMNSMKTWDKHFIKMDKHFIKMKSTESPYAQQLFVVFIISFW